MYNKIILSLHQAKSNQTKQTQNLFSGAVQIYLQPKKKNCAPTKKSLKYLTSVVCQRSTESKKSTELTSKMSGDLGETE